MSHSDPLAKSPFFLNCCSSSAWSSTLLIRILISLTFLFSHEACLTSSSAVELQSKSHGRVTSDSFLLYFYVCSIFRSSIFPVLNSFVMDFKIFFPLLFFCLNELQEDFFTSSLNFPNTLFFKLYQYEKGNSHHSGNYNNLQLLIPHLTPSS